MRSPTLLSAFLTVNNKNLGPLRAGRVHAHGVESRRAEQVPQPQEERDEADRRRFEDLAPTKGTLGAQAQRSADVAWEREGTFGGWAIVYADWAL